MSEHQGKLDPELEYVEVSFDGNAVVSENRRLRLSVFPADLRTECWRYQFVKRLVDVTGALLMTTIALIPCLVVAALVSLTSEGPIFYREWRVGRGGRPFRIWKFRSMHASNSWHEIATPRASHGVLLHWRVQKAGVDPRITPIGRFLRKWSLDELPQLINVLRGEMSLIGPRPVIEAEIPLYGQLRHFYLAAVPGLSGLWQVSGRSNVTFAKRAQLDAAYVQNWSLLGDFSILWKTIPAVLGRVGAR
jgi:lipopolysaccharide/colanic/teichoic acid biosynthesis glycosyltransferase